MRPGVELLDETVGTGAQVVRHKYYRFRLRITLSRGDLVKWTRPWGLIDHARLEDDSTTLVTDLRVDREFMFAGLFYGVQGMKLGGSRRLKIAPHLGYGETGGGGVPPNALLIVDAEALSEREMP